jgi:D-glycero-D-manno-heptose 1,7-bisphosphate phosphatase
LSRFASETAEKRHQVVRAVFLDRDGVINANLERNGKPVAPTCFADFRLLPGVDDAARRLKAAGFLLVVITNQPDVATGLTPRAECEAIHADIRRRLPIDDIVVCFHTDADNCTCRKPKAGMIFEAAAKHGIDLAASYMVGDRWRDVRAGHAAGCFTIFIDYGYPQDQSAEPDEIVTSLAEAASFILNKEMDKAPRATQMC